jgi:hypothetical protein
MKNSMKKKRQGLSGLAKKAFLAIALIAMSVIVFGLVNSVIDSGASDAPKKAYTLSAAGVGGGSTGAIVLYGYEKGEAWRTAAGLGAPNCPIGWIELYNGFGPFILGQLNDAGNFAALGAVEICSPQETLALTNLTMPSYGTFKYAIVDACDRIGYGGGGYNDIACNTCRVCIPDPGAAVSEPMSGDTILYAAMGTYSAALGGRSGADSICNNNMPSNLKAMQVAGNLEDVTAFLTVSPTDEIRDLHTIDNDGDGVTGNFLSERPIYGYNRQWGTYTKMGVNWEDLLDGTILSNLINALALSEDTDSTEYWTGSRDNGGVYTSASCTTNGQCTCNGWTTTSGSYKGKVGWGGYSGYAWMQEWYPDCDIANTFTLLCAARYT